MSTPIKTPNNVLKFNALEKDLSTSIATALWKKVAEIQQYINASHPIGMVIWFRHAQDLLPEMPDPKYWKEMDGTTVNNVNSPFHGYTLPDLRGKFLKHPSASESLHATGGADVKTVPHDHGGQTGYDDAYFDYIADNDDERSGPFWHNHTISSTAPSVDVRPPYQGLRFYLRIV
jgi:hypothetical protein